MLKELFIAATMGAFVAQATPAPLPLPTPTGSPMPVTTQTPSPRPSPSGTPLPTSTPSPSPWPSMGPTPPAATPLPPLPTPWPSGSPLALPTPLLLPPDAPPQIIAIQCDPVVHGGATFNGIVITSTNVAAVEIRLAGHAIRVPRTDFGIWQLQLQRPARSVLDAQELHRAGCSDEHCRLRNRARRYRSGAVTLTRAACRARGGR